MYIPISKNFYYLLSY